MRWVVRPSALSGQAVVPGDKSISHRAVMVALLARGESTIENLATGADVISTQECVTELGARISQTNGTTRIWGGEMGPSGTLDAGNSGTTIRLLSGILAGQPFQSTITGDESLRARPMNRVAEPLRLMGADVTTDGGRPPINVRGGDLDGISYAPPIPSAQVKSCILLAGLFARGETTVVEAAATRDHTERLLKHAGVPIHVKGNRVTVEGGRLPAPFALTAPGDMSSAAFLFAAAALMGSTVTVPGVGLNPCRTGFLRILERMGCGVETLEEGDQGGEPVGTVTVSGGELRATELGPEEAPACIDELPLVALLGTGAAGVSRVHGAGELRVKETDRVATVCHELRSLGADIREHADGFEVRGQTTLRGAVCRSHGDHRLAMMLAVAGLVAKGETVVEDAESAEVSFPGFADLLRSLGGRIDAG